ncbi:MAG: class I SAM-dependent methyltransferase [Bacilli bacterium]|nr:class I SAM-dependent methyltransferase [Bacilli bacterium]
MISLRLKTILSLINDEKRLIDIGCDHGLVGIFALKEQRVKEVIASDINPKSLSAAKANILKYNVSNMKTLVSDGFDNIDLKEDDLVLISGMGFKTI